MIYRQPLLRPERGPFIVSPILDPFTGRPYLRARPPEQPTLSEVLRTDAGIMWRQRRKRWSRLCTRAAEAIEACKCDPELAVELRAPAAFSEGKGRHGLAAKLSTAAAAVEVRSGP